MIDSPPHLNPTPEENGNKRHVGLQTLFLAALKQAVCACLVGTAAAF